MKPLKFRPSLHGCKPDFFLLFFSLAISCYGFAQNNGTDTWNTVTTADFSSGSAKMVNANANAVVLENVGSTEFEGSRNRDFMAYVFKRRVKILFVNQKAFKDLGHVSIILHGNDKWQERLEKLQASTYNLENGKIQETKLNQSEIYEEQIIDGVLEKKFTMPALKDGSVIEYSYQVTSDYIDNIPSWEFQYEGYPCLYSSFQLTVPTNMMAYLINRHGVDSFAVNKTESKGRKLYKMSSVNVTAVETMHKWVMTNVPALDKEDYINSTRECLDGLDFYLSQTYNGEEITNYSNSWGGLVNGLLANSNFGGVISYDATTNLFNEADRLTRNDKSLEEKMKHIYDFVRDNIEVTSTRSILAKGSLYNVYKQRKGSASEVNLLMIALMRQCKIAADPAILATKEKGFNPPQFGIQDKLNHVICVTWLYGDTIVLDASQKRIAFGKLPLKCYNGYARIVSHDHSGFIYLYPDDIKESNMTTLFLSNGDKGKINGTYEYVPGLYGSDLLRGVIQKSGVKDYFDKIKTAAADDYKISNEGIDSLNDYNNPVKIYYDLTLVDKGSPDHLYFDPVLKSDKLINPFKAESRKYAIQMDYPVDDMYLMTMEIPEGYVIDELPAPVSVPLNLVDGFFEYAVAKDETSIQIRIHVKMRRATFLPQEYGALRSFFAMVEKKENEQIVFKKKVAK